MDIIKLILNNPQIVIAIILFGVGWYFGTANERKHLATLDNDERLLGHIIISSERFFAPTVQADGMLVMGSVSIAQDRFKLVFADFLSLFGKNLTVYESLLDRGRREAIVRMKRQAYEHGYNQVYGIRIETSAVDGGGVEVLAYGTAVSSIGNPNVPPRLSAHL
ncbi:MULTISPECIES: YbjQ family protein [Moraxella]|uniref:Metal-binding protein n=1 Tax=Moraxella lacunata TaxID=477 RepID=A0A1B8PW72_MORLA|nr:MULTISPECIES: heavy metal-binding domain-containing protein [Moraxella]MBE9578350.1 heavy metal-binding domain-containing protein [Moraxella sp. K1664]MBE9587840.1 heavy metal-binding domain-containing protein [Moraxella sp. K1630]MBE9591593.1 heavy metal-binding domain-containing protein [Moraxella sp. K127]MBE9595929.1 heavy metal-binding domain-containing protein [Moraxella sp. K2450]MDH9220100.1 heavy metal-binding domain-containing protein [Moraxella lacunata]